MRVVLADPAAFTPQYDHELAHALGAAGVLGGATLLGVWLTGAVPALATHGLALAGGVTVYVGASNLIPEFQGKPGWHHSAAFVVGCVLYLAAHSALPV
mgnify:CR=1 FL=1